MRGYLRIVWRAGQVLAVGLLSVDCSGGEGGTPPVSDAVASVVIAAPSSPVRVYDKIRLSAVVLDRGGRALVKPIAWTSMQPDRAKVSADGEVEALAEGSVGIIAQSEAVSDTVYVEIAPAAIAFLEVSPRVLLMGTGLTFRITAAARDARGNPATQPITLLASNAAVSTNGLTIRAESPGTSTVFVRAGERIDSVQILVRSDFAFVQTATSLRAGAAISLYGDAVSAATITVGGSNASVFALADTLVRYTVPATPFAPCRPEGTMELAITRDGAITRVTLPSLSQPIEIDLAVGGHTFVPEAITSGCDVALSKAGDYLIMPFAWDRATSPYYNGTGPVTARLSVLDPLPNVGAASLGALTAAGHGPAASTGPARGFVTPYADFAHASPTAALVGDVLDMSALSIQAPNTVRASIEGPTAGVSCPIPLTPGQTVPIGTERSGGFVHLALRGSPTESWTLVAITPHLAVFYDTTMVRVAAGDALIADRLQRFVAAYDSTVIPLMQKYTDGIPDADGNSRVVMLLPYAPAGGFAYAMPNGYGRNDCTYGSEGGEAFLMRSSYLLTNPGINLATALALAAHETAHLVDLKASVSTGRQFTAWSSEGFAMQFNWLWSAGPLVTDPYSGNRPSAFTRVVEGTGTGYSCVEPQRSTWAALYAVGNNTVSYTGSCAMVRAIVARGVARGMTVRDALMRFVRLRYRYTFTSAMNEYEGTSRPAPEVVGEWLLMWYADGHVTGTAPALQDPAVQWRSAYHTTWPLPLENLAPGTTVNLTIGEPDVYHYLATMPAGGRFNIVQPSGFTAALAARASVGLLRVR